ncbi:MAG: hypothetical protein WBN16_10715, partial [Lutimonas sp.]
MKKTSFYLVIAVFTAVLFGQSVNAQSYKEEIDMFQSMFGMEKKALVADFLEIEESNPFWAVYDEYESKRKALGQNRLVALSNYADNYETMNDAGYDSTIKTMMDLRKQNDKLIDSYYKKAKKASGSKVAGQFFQIESYIQSEVRSTIMSGIPFIGEL